VINVLQKEKEVLEQRAMAIIMKKVMEVVENEIEEDTLHNEP
jgi:hypothetical protein